MIEMCSSRGGIGGSLESTIHVLAFASLEHNNVHVYELTAQPCGYLCENNLITTTTVTLNFCVIAVKY